MARPRSFDPQAVLLAVERQFRRGGYAGTSLDDIAAATGLGRGSLYAAFGDKHSLFLKALDHYCDRQEPLVIGLLSGPDEEAVDRLRLYLSGTVRLVFDDEERLGCMAGKFAVELAGQDDEATQRINREFQLIRQALITCVQGAQRHGDLDATASAEHLASLLMTVTRGIDVLAAAGRCPDELEMAAESAFLSLPFAPGRRPGRPGDS